MKLNLLAYWRLKTFFVCLICLMSFGAAHAQLQNITGTVSSGGEPLPGVSVVVKGTKVGSSVDISKTLEWTGNDIDTDIEEYEVYLSTTNPPTTLKGTTTTTTINNLSLESATVYYWSVVTKDSFGNQSTSPVFEFRTN